VRLLRLGHLRHGVISFLEAGFVRDSDALPLHPSHPVHPVLEKNRKAEEERISDAVY
jgi:hypothetical protein